MDSLNNFTLEQMQQGKTVPILRTEKSQAADEDWYGTRNGIMFAPFGFPGNFDVNVSFKLPFYIDIDVKKILIAKVTLIFQKFRVDTQPLAHHHSVNVPSHTHSVTISNHTHSVTISNHTHNTSVSDHTHSITLTAFNRSIVGKNALYINPGSSPHILADIDPLNYGDPAYDDDLFLGVTTSSVQAGGSFTQTSSNGGSATVTSANGGGATVTSASGGGATVTSDDVAGAAYGLFEGTYPTDVHVLIDGIDITANIGGPFNPGIGSDVIADIDITSFIEGQTGLHTLELTTPSVGRCLPLLWIKAIISR